MLLQCVAMIIATSCGSDTPDDGSFRPVPPRNAEEQAIADLTYVIKRDLDTLRTRPMSEEQKSRLDVAEARVRRALRELRDTHEQGSYRGVAMARIGTVSAALAADNVSGVGVADDPLLILCGLAAVVAIAATSAAASPSERKYSWDELHDSLLDLESAIAAVTAETCTEPIDLTAHEQANGDAEADSTTRVTSEPLADTATRRYGPNQKCSDDELDKLQGLANSICKGRGQNTCSSSKVSARRLAKLRCSEVLRRQAHHEACLSARIEVQKRCFHRTDDGHQIAIDNRTDAVASCKELAEQQCAPDSRYNDQ